GTPHFDVSTVGVRRKVRSGQGLTIPVQAIPPDSRPDWVIVPALKMTTPETLEAAFGSHKGDILNSRRDLRNMGKVIPWKLRSIIFCLDANKFTNVPFSVHGCFSP